MKFLSKLGKKSLTNKTCIVRVGFDVKNQKETFRLTQALPTIKFLLNNKSKVILITHRNRPKKRDKSNSLSIILPFLKKNLHKNVIFLNNFNFKKIKKAIQKSKPGSLFLLENIRYLPGEKKNSPVLGKKLASLGDIYINEAFSNSHRNHASMVQLPKHLPSFAGLSLETEINAMDKILKSGKKPLVAIIGGAKVPEKMGIIKNFINKAQFFLISGVVANTFLKARGFNIGNSVFDPKMVKLARKLLSNKKIILPIDFIASQNKLLDLGPLTTEIFKEKIKQAKTILWNGPLGYFEDEKFNKASFSIARSIAKSKAFSLVGGGETVYIIHRLKLEKKISFLSTGGGAMLEYLSGKKLPGIEALGKTPHQNRRQGKGSGKR